MSNTVRARVLVSGRVQGVFFRAETRQRASSLGLGGWVRNLPDGRLEAVFEGGTSEVNAAVDWCRKGPLHARVEDVEVAYEEPTGETGFRIKY